MLEKIKNILQNRHVYINLLSHWGFKYKCPFCGFHSRKLNPIGIDTPTIRRYQIIGAGLRNAGCPKSPTIKSKIVENSINYQSDVYFTILNLIGFEDYYWKGVGQNILSKDKSNRIDEETGYRISDAVIRNDYFKRYTKLNRKH